MPDLILEIDESDSEELGEGLEQSQVMYGDEILLDGSESDEPE